MLKLFNMQIFFIIIHLDYHPFMPALQRNNINNEHYRKIRQLYVFKKRALKTLNCKTCNPGSNSVEDENIFFIIIHLGIHFTSASQRNNNKNEHYRKIRQLYVLKKRALKTLNCKTQQSKLKLGRRRKYFFYHIPSRNPFYACLTEK